MPVASNMRMLTAYGPAMLPCRLITIRASESSAVHVGSPRLAVVPALHRRPRRPQMAAVAPEVDRHLAGCLREDPVRPPMLRSAERADEDGVVDD